MGVIPSLLTLVKSSSASPLASEELIAASPFLASLSVVVLVSLSAGNMPVKVGSCVWIYLVFEFIFQFEWNI